VKFFVDSGKAVDALSFYYICAKKR